MATVLKGRFGAVHVLATFGVRHCPLVTIRVPVITIYIDTSSRTTRHINCICSCEITRGWTEVHRFWHTLISFTIGPSKSFNFERLRRTISIEHTFSCTTSCGKVTKTLILPVSPWEKLAIKSIKWACDFVIALLCVKTSAELCKNQRHAKPLSICSALGSLMEMECAAHLLIFKRRFTFGAGVGVSLTTVGMGIQRLSIEVVWATRGLFETNWEYFAAEKG